MTAGSPAPVRTGATPPSPAGGLVDAHQHVWELSAHDQPWLRLPGNESLLRDFSEADLRPQAAAAGIGATVVVQTVAELSETTELLALAASSDLVAAVVGWVDLAAGGVFEDIAVLRDRPDGAYLRGIRHPLLTEPDPGWVLRGEVLAGLAAVGRAGLCFDLVLPLRLLPAATAAAAACPGVTFVLDHLGNPEVVPWPDEEWARGVRGLAELPNTACKLSGILGVPPPGGGTGVAHLVPYYETALEAFGPGRLMFGSDWPVCTLSASYATVAAAARALTAGLSPAELAAVLGGTARRVYRIGPDGPKS